MNYQAVNEKVLKTAFEKFVGKAATGKTAKDMVEALTAVFRKTKGNKLTCDTCTGASPEDLDHCPFCGAADEEGMVLSGSKSVAPPPPPPVIEKPTVVAAEKKAPPARKLKSNGTNGHANGGLQMHEANGTTDIDASVVLGMDLAAPGAIDKAVTSIVQVKPGAKLLKFPGPERVVNGKALELKNETNLDAALVACSHLKSEGAAWAWKLGDFVRREIFEPQLWMLRLDDKQKAKWKSFDQFCREELHLVPNFVYRMMGVAKDFSLEEAEKYGTTKLKLILSAPPEDRQELVKKLSESNGGVTVDEIYSDVQGARAARGVSEVQNFGKPRKAPTGVKAGRPTSSLAGKVKQNPNSTAILPKQRCTIQLFAKGKKGEDPKPAKKLADNPVGILKCVNDVQIRAVLLESASGQLIVQLEVIRGAAE